MFYGVGLRKGSFVTGWLSLVSYLWRLSVFIIPVVFLEHIT